MTSLKDDILAPVRQKLLEENQQMLVNLPQDLEANFVKSSGRAAPSGAAAAKLQFVAAVPAAIVAGVLEYLSGSRAGGN